MPRHPAFPWIAPFAAFMLALSVAPWMGLPPRAELFLRFALPLAALLAFSRHLIEFRVNRFFGSSLVGLAVFLIWIAPDALFPEYRSHWLFQNALTGSLTFSMTPEARNDFISIVLRVLRAAVVVPIVEELFWRGWLMRWVIRHKFEEVPLGTYAPAAFWITAALFALEHGPYWEVGFLSGAVYNWYLVRVKRISDLILAHSVTNACLAAYVLATGRWEYWM